MTPDDDRFGEALEKLKRRLKVNSTVELLFALLREQPEFEGILKPGRGKRVKRRPKDVKLLKAINEGWRNWLRATGQEWTPLDEKVLLRGIKRHGEFLEDPRAAARRLIRLEEKVLRPERERLARALLQGQIKK